MGSRQFVTQPWGSVAAGGWLLWHQGLVPAGMVAGPSSGEDLGEDCRISRGLV